MSWIGVLFWLLPKRLGSSWVLLAVTAFGVLTAVTLISVGAVYSRALAEGGLRHTLATASPLITNTQIVAQSRPLSPADYAQLRASVEGLSETHLGFMLRDIQRFGRVQPNMPLDSTLGDNVRFSDTPNGRLFFQTGFERHSRLLEGRWPEQKPVQTENEVILEVVVGKSTAASMAWVIDSQSYLFPYRRDLSDRIIVKIVGLAEPIDPSDEYWMGNTSHFAPQDAGDAILMPLYLREEDYFGGLAARFPTLVGDFGWYLYQDTGVLNADLVQPTRDALASLEKELNKRVPRSQVFNGLENSRGTGLLARYQRSLALAQVPIFLFLSLVVVVILYFLSLVTGLLTQTKSDEASLMRSRGASALQVGVLVTLGEGIIVVLATVIGPFLGLLIVRVFLLSTINPLGDDGSLSVGIKPDMFIWGAVGGLLSLAVLVMASVGLSRLGILEFLHQRARPPTIPLLQRYYLDLLVIAVLALIWWQTRERGGFVDQALTDRSIQVDPSVLIGPALVLLTAAFLMLRLLPLLLRLLAWLTAPVAPAWASFALARMARDPLPYASLTVIVMLAAALGAFGASFQSTLSQSQQEQALYQVGGDLVVRGLPDFFARREQLPNELLAASGVATVSPLSREGVTVLGGAVQGNVTLLAVDPVTLPESAWFREDFTEEGMSLSELLTPLRRGQSRLPALGGHRASGIPLPESSERVGIWINSSGLGQSIVQQALKLQFRLADSQGRYHNLSLGNINFSGGALGMATEGSGDWTFYEAPLPLEEVGVTPPLSLVSIALIGQSFYRMPPGTIFLDELTVKPGPAASPEGLVIESFEELGRWQTLTHDGEIDDIIEITADAARGQGQGLAFTWEDPVLKIPRGILIPPGILPLPAIGSSQFGLRQQVKIKTGTQLVPVEVLEIAELFPTVNTRSSPFLIVSLENYDRYLRRLSGGESKPPTEFWLSLEDNANREQAIAELEEALPAISSVRDRDAVVDRARRNPLAGGGWNGLTLLSLVTLTVAVVLALGTQAAIAVRAGRVDLTVARALGFSRLQLVWSLALERLLVTAVGLIAGVAIGLRLSRWVLGFLDQTASGREVLPPMILLVEQWIVALVVLSIAGAALLAILFAALAARRLRPSDILRTGE